MPFGITAILNEIIGGAAGRYKKSVERWTKQLATQLSKNQDLVSKIHEAFNDKNLNLVNSIVASSPFGASFQHLKKMSSKLKNARDTEIDKLNKDRVETEKQLNSANDLMNNLNGGMYQAGNAMERYDKNIRNELKEGVANSEKRQSNIDGGLVNAGRNTGIGSINVK